MSDRIESIDSIRLVEIRANGPGHSNYKPEVSCSIEFSRNCDPSVCGSRVALFSPLDAEVKKALMP